MKWTSFTLKLFWVVILILTVNLLRGIVSRSGSYFPAET
jgi:hypothetical protein